jgi:hypothetical protein
MAGVSMAKPVYGDRRVDAGALCGGFDDIVHGALSERLAGTPD